MSSNAGTTSIEYGDTARSLERAAAPHRLVLLGELHGTREIPLFVGQLVSDYARSRPVVLGLEIPASEQHAIDRYLSSTGHLGARRRLQEGSFWQRKDVQHDGRRSYAVLTLINHVRELRAAGASVRILAYDDPAGTEHPSESRDREMAQRIRKTFVADPNSLFLILSGNVHAMLRRPNDAPGEMQTPMGAHLLNLSPFSVDITARSGKSWACMARCQAVPLASTHAVTGPLKEGSYDYLVVLPRLSVARLIGGPAVREWRER